MTFRIFMAVALAVGVLVLGMWALSSAQAQGMYCSDREGVLKRLNERYDEMIVNRGLATNGSVLEVLSSPEGATWTILITRPNGKSCLLATGEAWGPVTRSEGPRT